MKSFCIILCLFFVTEIYAQVEDESVCYVISVKGDIWKPSGLKLVPFDTIIFKDLHSLKYVSEGSQVIFHHPKLGSFRLSQKEIASSSEHENFGDFLTHLIKIKGTQISLSSRGGCDCSAPQSCFFTDTTFNDKVLIIDSISFVADESLFAADAGTYFLQKQAENGKTLTNKLSMRNEIVYIYPKDLFFKDSSNADDGADRLVLGLYTVKDDLKNTRSIIKIKFKVTSSTILKEYYSALRKAMKGQSPKEIHDEFCKDVYIYFGKPNECQLNKIINYTN